MRRIRISNSEGLDGAVGIDGVRAPKAPQLGLPDTVVRHRRYLASTETGLDNALSERFGENYSQALIDEDPEIDIEQVGRFIDETDTVYLSNKGEILHAVPEIVEVLYGPDNSEIERRPPLDVEANINDDFPVAWTGRTFGKEEAVRKFAFARSMQLFHRDGLSYDFLFKIAKQLHDDNCLLLMGTGPSGKDPLIFQANGTPYRAFLEGRVDGSKYQLVMHLSNLELKGPAPAETKKVGR